MDKFTKDCLRTESTVFNVKPGTDRLLHAALGLQTESAEFSDQLKKHVFYGKPLDKINLKEELGDLLWYIAIAMDVLDTTFSQEQTRVVNKLKARYPEKFSLEQASNRDLVKERRILEEGN
jgi:NTP pyrophosphatase (non-canonical NTP hydrolase)